MPIKNVSQVDAHVHSKRLLCYEFAVQSDDVWIANICFQTCICTWEDPLNSSDLLLYLSSLLIFSHGSSYQTHIFLLVAQKCLHTNQQMRTMKCIFSEDQGVFPQLHHYENAMPFASKAYQAVTRVTVNRELCHWNLMLKLLLLKSMFLIQLIE